MKKTAEEAAANGCRFPLAVWVQRGLKPGGCKQYSLDGRITLGSCMTTDFSSHNHAEAPLAPPKSVTGIHWMWPAQLKKSVSQCACLCLIACTPKRGWV